jgi:hypothetical protein
MSERAIEKYVMRKAARQRSSIGGKELVSNPDITTHRKRSELLEHLSVIVQLLLVNRIFVIVFWKRHWVLGRARHGGVCSS